MKDCPSFLLAKGMHLTENITLRYLSRYSVDYFELDNCISVNRKGISLTILVEIFILKHIFQTNPNPRTDSQKGLMLNYPLTKYLDNIKHSNMLLS